MIETSKVISLADTTCEVYHRDSTVLREANKMLKEGKRLLCSKTVTWEDNGITRKALVSHRADNAEQIIDSVISIEDDPRVYVISKIKIEDYVIYEAVRV